MNQTRISWDLPLKCVGSCYQWGCAEVLEVLKADIARYKLCALTTPTYTLVYSSYCIFLYYIATTHERPFYKAIIASSKQEFTSTINHRSLRNQSAHSMQCSHARGNHYFDASLLSSNSTVSSPNKWARLHTSIFFYFFFRLHNLISSEQIK